MAVTQVGTPTATAYTTTSGANTATNTWSGTQPRTAGHILVMVINAAAITSVTLPAAPAGWSTAWNIGNYTTTPHALSACFYTVAAGSDAAPSVTVTTSGTTRVGTQLFELAGGDTIRPVDTSGTYASGTSPATIASWSFATGASVTAAGEYVITAFSREQATAAAATFATTDSSTLFTTSGAESSSRDHDMVSYYAGPSSGSAFTASGTVTSAATSYAAGGVAVFGLAPETSPSLEAYGFAIPDPPGYADTINSVTIAVTEHQSSALQDPCTFQLWDYSSTPAQIGATQTGTASTSTSNVSSATFSGVTYAQLATLRVRIFGNALAGSGYTESVDGVSLVINYTSAGSYAGLATGTGAAPASVLAPAGLAAGTGTGVQTAQHPAGLATLTGTAVQPGGAETSPSLEVYGFAIPSPPHSPDTINSVTVAITEHQSNAAQAACTFELWDYSSTPAIIGTTQTGTASTSTGNVSTATFTGVSYAQLATLRVRIFGHAPAGSGYIESVDGVSLVVTYTPAPGYAWPGAASLTGTAQAGQAGTFTDAAAGLATGTGAAVQTAQHYAAPAALAGTAPGVFQSYITQIIGSGANGYFADSSGSPVLLLSETNWSLISNAGGQGYGTWQQDIDFYCDSRAAQGFTGLQVCVFAATANDTDYPYGSTWDGVYPFTSGDDPSTGLNNTFWARVDYFIAACARNSMVAWINLAYGTADDPSQPGPFYSSSTGNHQITTAQAQAFGTALAARYASTPNIMWQYGGDYFGSWDNLLTGITSELRAGGDTHLVSIENSTETTSRYSFDSGNYNAEQAFGYADAQFNCVYTYVQSYYGVRYAYGEASPLPVVWVDGYYYLSDGGDTYYDPYDRGERQVVWWCLSSGARGVNPTSTFVWPWAGSDADKGSHWQVTNEYFFTNTAGNIITAVSSLPGWWKLLPDLTGSFITAGGGTPLASDTYDENRTDYGGATTDNFVTASVAPDGSLALIYLSHASTITIDQTKLQSGYTVKWIDPDSGAVYAGTPGGTYNSGAADGSKPILNSTGDPDWVLALAAPAAVTAAAGLAAGTGTAVQTAQHPAGLTAGTGTAQAGQASVLAPAGLATGTGTAVQTAQHPAGLATGTGTAQAAVPAGTTAGLATGTGTAQAAAPAATAAPGLATLTGWVWQPQIAPYALTQPGIPVARQPRWRPGRARLGPLGAASAGTTLASAVVTAGLATGAGAAQQPSVATTAVYTLHSGATYGLASSGNGAQQSFGVQFSVSTTLTLTGIWWYSQPGAAALPVSCALYNANTQAQISGTLNSSPAWSGAAGSGWVKCSYNGPALSSGINYVAVVHKDTSFIYPQVASYWTSGGGSTGITNGALSAPSSAASVNGQATYLSSGALAFPTSTISGYDFGVDVEVSALPAVNAPAGLASGTGAASASAMVPAGLATGAGTAQQPSANTTGPGNAPAGLPAGTGAVPAPAMGRAGLATGTGTAQQPVVSHGYRLMDGASGRPGVGSSGTQPPAAATGLTGPYTVGTSFVTTSPCWFEGYWWWLTSSGGQPAGAQEFCLWSANIDGSAGRRGSVVPAATVTSGALTPGWNYVPLAAPVPLTIGWTYVAATGWASGSGIPYTSAQFGSGNPYSAGIVNGPLTGFSDTGGSNPDPFENFQCGYARTAGNPAADFPTTDSSAFNGWLDLQVTSTPPAGATYRLFPSLEGYQLGTSLDYNNPTDPDGYTIGNTFTLSQPCQLLRIWFWSGTGATALPTRCAIWDVATQTEIAGTDNASPSWLTESGGAASPGSGWVYCDYSGSGIALPAGRNMISAAYSAFATVWRYFCLPFWGTGGISGGPAINLGAGGLDYGVISAPSTAGGTPLQGGYYGPNLGWGFPGLWNNPENDWTDVEVTPAGAVAAGLAAAAGAAQQPAVMAGNAVPAGLAAAAGIAEQPAVQVTGGEVSPALETYAFGAFPQIPPGSAISGVTVVLGHCESDSSMGAPLFELHAADGTLLGSGTGTTSTDPRHEDQATFSGISYAQLDGLRVRIYASQGGASSGAVAQVGWVSLVVAFTPAGNAAVVPATLTAATGFGAAAASGVTSAAITAAGPAAAAGFPQCTMGLYAAVLPAILAATAGFPAATASGIISAAITSSAIAATAGFPQCTAGLLAAAAFPARLTTAAGFPAAVASGVISASAAPAVLSVTAGFIQCTAGLQAAAVLPAQLTAAAGFPSAAVLGVINAAVAPAMLAAFAAVPACLVIASSTGPDYPASAGVLAGGTGTWADPVAAAGPPPDASNAEWTVP